MPARNRHFALYLSLGLFAMIAQPVRGVILYPSATRNTSVDPASIAYAGWQLQGQWLDFLGTPIAPQYFIAATHTGGSSATPFLFQSVSYNIDPSFGTGGKLDVPGSDLTIWKVSGTFPAWAPLYTSSDEVGKHIAIFGRGTQRGNDVVVDSSLKGWLWGTDDHVQSWGENDVSSTPSFSNVGEMLAFTFDAGNHPNEGTLSAGDSGGGVFINDGGVWKIAGINYSVESPFSTSSTGENAFDAALFDKSGLFEETGPGVWTFNSPTGQNQPAAAYASRISAHAAFIQSVIPEPSSLMLLIATLVPIATLRSRRR